MPNEPKEESLTASPAASVLEISLKISSTSSWDSLRGRPTLCTTASARSARVSVLPPIGKPLPNTLPAADASRGQFRGQHQQAEIAHINGDGVAFTTAPGRRPR